MPERIKPIIVGIFQPKTSNIVPRKRSIITMLNSE